MREQAEQVVGHYAGSQRAILLETFRQIVKAATLRLDAGTAWGSSKRLHRAVVLPADFCVSFVAGFLSARSDGDDPPYRGTPNAACR